MRQTDALVIGSGQAGLAISYCLTANGVDHVVLERGRVAERWQASAGIHCACLSPNWMSRLPGWSYSGPEPDGFMTAHEVTDYLGAYAQSFSAPVEIDTAVRMVHRIPGGYRVETTRGTWQASVVVIATGQCDQPFVPEMGRNLPPSIQQVTPSSYRNPGSLPAGGVLVVGASASGVQLAQEIHASGRPVSIAVGSHARLPRLYRGRDIMAWLDRAGVLDDRASQMRDIARARTSGSWQLIGHPDRRHTRPFRAPAGGRPPARTSMDVANGVLHLKDDLAGTTAAAQGVLERLLARIDPVADADRAPLEDWPAGFDPGASPERLDLQAEDICTVVWCTGFKRNYSWLQIPSAMRRVKSVMKAGSRRYPVCMCLGCASCEDDDPISSTGSEPTLRK